MAIETMTNTHERAGHGVQAELQQSLLELIDIALQGKQAHWNVVGPAFRPVHQQLDEIVDAARLASDEVAERIATLGGVPDGRAEAVADARPFEPFPGGNVKAEHAVEAMLQRLNELNQRLRGRIDRLAEADPISQGILIEAATHLEKQTWMLRAQRG
jgi:starvation-inducible DNA-binding protein